MINYNYWINKYTWNDGASVYINNNMLEFTNFIGTPRQCEDEIIRIISGINADNIQQKNNDILTVIDLINQWGGQTSRMFYSRHARNNFQSPRDRISSEISLNIYKRGIIEAMQINENAFTTFREIYGISDSFSGKHAMFWSNFNLIIIDNKIAGALGFKKPNSLLNSRSYQDILNDFRIIQNENQFSNPTMVERALFAFHSNYFKNDNSGFKNNITDFNDREYAVQLGEILELEMPNW
jgi:hypothetical protein